MAQVQILVPSSVTEEQIEICQEKVHTGRCTAQNRTALQRLIETTIGSRPLSASGIGDKRYSLYSVVTGQNWFRFNTHNTNQVVGAFKDSSVRTIGGCRKLANAHPLV